MTPEEKAARRERVSADIDARLVEVWAIVWRDLSMTEESMAVMAAFLRASYSIGYQDALREVEEGKPGELARAHGYTHV